MSGVEIAERVLASVGLGVLAIMTLILAVRLVAFFWTVLFGQTVRVVVHHPDGTTKTVRRTVSNDDELIELLDDPTSRRR